MIRCEQCGSQAHAHIDGEAECWWLCMDCFWNAVRNKTKEEEGNDKNTTSWPASSSEICGEGS